MIPPRLGLCSNSAFHRVHSRSLYTQIKKVNSQFSDHGLYWILGRFRGEVRPIVPIRSRKSNSLQLNYAALMWFWFDAISRLWRVLFYLLAQTRYAMKYRHCDGKLVLKVTDDKEVKFLNTYTCLCFEILLDSGHVYLRVFFIGFENARTLHVNT